MSFSTVLPAVPDNQQTKQYKFKTKPNVHVSCKCRFHISDPPKRSHREFPVSISK